ncbi:hypothetical protein UA08_06201 [Talaromyces atroroseus]|uniref:Protein FYV10 n=1 Tax=Talaromyces atroroseus TaxID=1441469 RepID=A0A225AMS9_TALAT|nr:hypothetical protein UA08_06201 [Talaromyces atroroseus]OKL58578.1 hypothetical protein UA08_06201 [Talaromyces atroroseus]
MSPPLSRAGGAAATSSSSSTSTSTSASTSSSSYASVVANNSSSSFPRHLATSSRRLPHLHRPEHPTADAATTTSPTSSTSSASSPQLLPHTASTATAATTTTTATTAVTTARRNSILVPATHADMQMNYGWRRSSGLPSYSRQFANIPDYAGAAGSGPGPGANGFQSSFTSLAAAAGFVPSITASASSPFSDPSFFIPSYLRNSRYVARLEAARRSKLAAAQREPPPPPSASVPASASASTSNIINTNQPSLSASSSHASLHRMVPSHRGMTHDIAEKEPAIVEDKPQPLPSRWNDSDRHEGLDLLNDGMEVRYMGHPHKADYEAASVRADFPMPREGGIYYYETTILVKPRDAVIAIGFSSSKASLERLPGWDSESWAYHGDDGKAFIGESQGQGRPYGPTFSVNDTIGCGINFTTGCAFFTKNGIMIGIAFRDLPASKSIAFYPSIGMKRHHGMHIRTNFGQQPFMYDIDGLVKKDKLALLSEINETSTANLQPPLDEATLLQELVAQFLAQDGYYETAHAFAEEVRQESVILENGQSRSLYQYEPGEDIDAAHRQKIRAAILEGDIDKALKYTNAYFSQVLQDNPRILFKLRCRKFLEMLCKCSDISSATTTANKKPIHSDDQVLEPEEGEEEEDMEVDDQDGYSDADGMDTEETTTVTTDDTAKFHDLLTEAVQYGQQLRMDYLSDENAGDKQYLADIFSLVAYSDPRSSVHGHHLDASGRVAVADDLNSAILVSLGKSSSAALETLYSQTEVLVNELSEDGGTGSLINIRGDFLA